MIPLHRLAGALALAAVALAAPPAAAASPGDGYTMLEPDAVEGLIRAGSARVYDANPRDVYDEHHLPGAVFIGHRKDLDAVLPADRAQPLVFYCAGPK